MNIETKNILINALEKYLDSKLDEAGSDYNDWVSIEVLMPKALDLIEDEMHLLTLPPVKEVKDGINITRYVGLVKTDEDKENAGYRVIYHLDLEEELFDDLKEVYQITLDWYNGAH